MKKYTANEIQEISAEFRQIARRLSRTDYNQCDANLIRFLTFIENTPIIIDFINENNIKEYDIKRIRDERDWLDPFSISPNKAEEISFEFQMLEYARKEYEGDFTRLYGTQIYTSTKSSVNDELRTFVCHVIDPLIDHINDYLQQCYRVSTTLEKKTILDTAPSLTATNSTIVIGSTIEGGVTNKINNSLQNQSEVELTIKQVREFLKEFKDEKKEDVLEIIDLVEESIKKNEKPKKGFLTTLQSLTQFIPQLVPLITLLINQINK